jgi:hypothetical protein
MREITILVGRDENPLILPDAAWVVKPLAALGECVIWFYADDTLDYTDRMHAMLERMLHVAVGACVGESVPPFHVEQPNTVLVLIPHADHDEITAVGAIADLIREANGWNRPLTELGIVNLPRRDSVAILDKVMEVLIPSVVFFYAPDSLAHDPDDAMELTSYLQSLARKYESAVVLCLATSEEHVAQIIEAARDETRDETRD